MNRFFGILLLIGIAGCGIASAHPTLDRAPKAKRVLPLEDDGPQPAPSPAPAPTPAPVVPTLSLPPTIEGDAGDFVKVTATTNGSHVRWQALDKGLAVFPGEMLRDSKMTVVTAQAGGQYRLLAYTALNDLPSDPVVTTIVIRGPPAPAPAPQPAPQPPPGPAPAPHPGPEPSPQPPPPAPVPVRTAEKLFIVTVDPVTGRTPGRMAALAAFRTAALGGAGQFAMLNDTSAEAKQFADQIAAAGGLLTGVVIVMDAKANPDGTHTWLNRPGKDPLTGYIDVTDLRLPESAEAALALVKKYRGQ